MNKMMGGSFAWDFKGKQVEVEVIEHMAGLQ